MNMKATSVLGDREIPRVFHQTGPNRLSELATSCISSLKKHHPGWGYRFWTDEQLDEIVLSEEYCWMAPVYRECSMIQKTDIARYCILHAHGGVYCDTDVMWHGTIDSLLSGGCMLHLAHSHPIFPTGGRVYVTNYLMASPARHGFWLDVLHTSRRRLSRHIMLRAIPRSLQVTYCTGAVLLSDMVPSVPMGEYTVFREPGVVDMFCENTPVCRDTVAVHHGGTSRPGSGGWSTFTNVVKHECRLREMTGVDRTGCQAPYMTLVFYSVVAMSIVSVSLVVFFLHRRAV